MEEQAGSSSSICYFIRHGDHLHHHRYREGRRIRTIVRAGCTSTEGLAESSSSFAQSLVLS